MGLGLEAGSFLWWKERAPSQSSTRGKTPSTALGDGAPPPERRSQDGQLPAGNLSRGVGFSGRLN